MNEKKDILQIFGILMKNPSLLSKTDKYNLTLADFSTRFEKYIFGAIKGLYDNGAKSIDIIDIENFISVNLTAKTVFDQNNGIEYLQDAKEYSEEGNFDYYYTHLKKINTLKSLKKSGFDISDFYCDDPVSSKYLEVNKNFEDLTIKDILDSVKKKLMGVEKNFLQDNVSESKDIFDGIEEIIEEAHLHEDIGLPLQGRIFNTVIAGARKGTLTIRSGGSGLGKTRNMVGDACYLAFPIRYNQTTCSWVEEGSCERVLYIATEQTRKEIQRMVLAYITGLNESRFRYGDFSEREEEIIKQALYLLKKFRNNLYIVQMPNPTNELIKSVMREHKLLYDVEYIFYDYVFICPSILNEFKGFSLRNDEILLILATTLKDLAVELDVFMMTATQVNANADNNENIRNESSLAGGRATINKADNGFIMARPTKEELDTLGDCINKCGKAPNIVIDVFKVRSGEYTQVRIWSFFEFGTLRRNDLFLTDNRMEEVNVTYDFNIAEHKLNEQERNEVIDGLQDLGYTNNVISPSLKSNIIKLI